LLQEKERTELQSELESRKIQTENTKAVPREEALFEGSVYLEDYEIPFHKDIGMPEPVAAVSLQL
jgi:hypothetical protein